MTYSKSINKYVKQVPDETIIWRYLTSEKLLWLLRDDSIYFRQLKAFLDENEGDIAVFWENMLKGDLGEMYAQKKDAPNFPRSYCGASCWHMNNGLSEKMWQMYSNRMGGVIQTTVGQLKSSIGNNTDYGFVEYGAINYTQKPPTVPHGTAFGLDIAMFYKSKEYEFEQEFRALIYAVKKHGMYLINKNQGINITVSIPDVINKIYISKYENNIFLHIIENLLDKSDLTNNLIEVI